jgi:hypothetical protein
MTSRRDKERVPQPPLGGSLPLLVHLHDGMQSARCDGVGLLGLSFFVKCLIVGLNLGFEIGPAVGQRPNGSFRAAAADNSIGGGSCGGGQKAAFLLDRREGNNLLDDGFNGLEDVPCGAGMMMAVDLGSSLLS